MAGSWGLETGDWWHSRTVISSRARNLCHSRRGTYAFSTCAALFRFPHLSFLPPVPYPPLWGTFPSRGRLTIRGKPISADLRASLHIYSRRSRHHHFSFLIQARLQSPMKGQHAPWADPSPLHLQQRAVRCTAPFFISFLFWRPSLLPVSHPPCRGRDCRSLPASSPSCTKPETCPSTYSASP